MNSDDALTPAIRRSPRAALEAQKHRNHLQFVFEDSDELNEAAPPPKARSRSASLKNEQSSIPRSLSASSFLTVNPLRAHPVGVIPPLKNSARQFSRPFRDLERQHVQSPDSPTLVQLSSRRHPRGLMSYRNNKRELGNIKKLPPHLRRQTSLETINSVTTTASEHAGEYDQDSLEAEAPSPDWFSADTSATSKHSSIFSSSGSQSSTPLETPLEFGSLDHHSPQSLFRKMMPRKIHKIEESPRSPTGLVIDKSTSIYRTSHRSSLLRSTNNFPHERFAPSLCTAQGSRSGSKSSSSSKWSASNFDISTLTEAEIKKCQKKGINPALYAEMRAAKKGKWTSPIAGNTFL
ncbi:hypothetical protein EJ02DRAFT_456620 [Clathrospora elynae]|uniref:Uncharacterized protein n=1 Tax=Clathrospora elynae TaxID=706981 RepID=A0A6A5SJX9_9PLEO|nr:hypothetical protein EJ02DRAFT_456620 [Clathrospora elynae]